VCLWWSEVAARGRRSPAWTPAKLAMDGMRQLGQIDLGSDDCVVAPSSRRGWDLLLATCRALVLRRAEPCSCVRTGIVDPGAGVTALAPRVCGYPHPAIRRWPGTPPLVRPRITLWSAHREARPKTGDGCRASAFRPPCPIERGAGGRPSPGERDTDGRAVDRAGESRRAREREEFLLDLRVEDALVVAQPGLDQAAALIDDRLAFVRLERVQR
jgi:hypothetical protein